jgi:predicted PurR-regulated permease PerM
MDKEVVISIKTIIITFLLVLLGYALYELGPVIGVILLAALIVISIEPLVKTLMKVQIGKKFPRGLAVTISYLLVLAFIIAAVTLVAPPVLIQFEKLIQNSSSIADQLNKFTGYRFANLNIMPNQTDVTNKALSVTLSVFSNVAEVISVFILSLYMSLDWVNIKRTLLSFFPENIKDTAHDAFIEIETTVAQWTKGELVLMGVVGSFSLVGLEILAVPYPLALALMAGLLEIVPIIGPIIAGVVASLVAFADSPIKALGVAILYIIIQEAEGNILVPKVMQKVSGFSPLIILIALLIGSKFFGIIGAVVSVPMVMIFTIVLKRVISAGSL